jgi:lipopolysaccharide/colanic/teichoic acid biosynthesis glycosyltransferase
LKRLFDLFASFLGLLILSPLFLLLIPIIPLDGKGGPFFRQTRVGKDGRTFGLLKFRTMVPDAGSGGKLTIGEDPRITKAGRFLRKHKLDELPQLINVLKGDMSLVGPRPEVPEYVAYFDPEQRKVLSVRPGLTDEASIAYLEEGELLRQADDPHRVYIEEILPEKLRLNLRYVEERSMKKDLLLIWKTLLRIVRG